MEVCFHDQGGGNGDAIVGERTGFDFNKSSFPASFSIATDWLIEVIPFDLSLNTLAPRIHSSGPVSDCLTSNLEEMNLLNHINIVSDDSVYMSSSIVLRCFTGQLESMSLLLILIWTYRYRQLIVWNLLFSSVHVIIIGLNCIPIGINLLSFKNTGRPPCWVSWGDVVRKLH